jgi:polar amino acid transport system ATP-binding protein
VTVAWTDAYDHGEADRPLVEIQGVYKKFGETVALNNFSFEITKGSVITTIGPSGSGKSTLLRCINALEPIDAGRILFKGTDIHAPGHKLTHLRRHVGMVFQQFNLFPHLNATENVALALRHIRKFSRSEAGSRAVSLLDRVGLGSMTKRYPNQLSGGQQQRVAIARALAMEPELMLFDEPTSALDPELVGEVLAVIRDLARQGMTMVIATHEIAFAAQVSTQVLFMTEGAIVEQGDANQVLRQPSHVRTQRFLERFNRPEGVSPALGSRLTIVSSSDGQQRKANG